MFQGEITYRFLADGDGGHTALVLEVNGSMYLTKSDNPCQSFDEGKEEITLYSKSRIQEKRPHKVIVFLAL